MTGPKAGRPIDLLSDLGLVRGGRRVVTVEAVAVDVTLAHFPTRDVDEPLTRDHLDSRLTEFREEIRVTLLTEFGAFDAKLASLDAKLTSETGALRGISTRSCTARCSGRSPR